MMEYHSNQPTVTTDKILIIGLGGAGTNILNSVQQYGLKNADTLAISADARALTTCKVKNKIQMGVKFRRGLACGGDPELGLKCAQESEADIRAKITGKKIVFLCVGLGGGSGSGASPLITRIAREENAFVVVFATMPFSFEGSRRRYQADNSMNELAAIASALVTFDNGRMAELVSPTDSVHAAFEASNKLISSSIASIARIALYPGIVHIGLDDLVSTLSTKRSRCLFGAGSAKGKGRVEQALNMALSSPLIDKGKLLNTSEKVIVHICGGPTTTMEETEQFMSGIVENLGISTEIFFGISIDKEMNDEFSATIISSVPEEKVQVPGTTEETAEAPIVAISDEPTEPVLEESSFETPTPEVEEVEEETEIFIEEAFVEEITAESEETESEDLVEVTAEEENHEVDLPEVETIESASEEEIEVEDEVEEEQLEELVPEEESVNESDTEIESAAEETEEEVPENDSAEATSTVAEEDVPEQKKESPVRRRFAHLFAPKAKEEPEITEKEVTVEDSSTDIEISSEAPVALEETELEQDLEPIAEADGIDQSPEADTSSDNKRKKPPEDDLFFAPSQSELLLDSQPKGRFEGESPNIFEGADLDIPTFLRTSE